MQLTGVNLYVFLVRNNNSRGPTSQKWENNPVPAGVQGQLNHDIRQCLLFLTFGTVCLSICENTFSDPNFAYLEL